MSVCVQDEMHQAFGCACWTKGFEVGQKTIDHDACVVTEGHLRSEVAEVERREGLLEGALIDKGQRHNSDALALMKTVEALEECRARLEPAVTAWEPIMPHSAEVMLNVVKAGLGHADSASAIKEVNANRRAAAQEVYVQTATALDSALSEVQEPDSSGDIHTDQPITQADV